jgi:hypothetical protein
MSSTEKKIKEINETCGRARSIIPAGENPVPNEWGQVFHCAQRINNEWGQVFHCAQRITKSYFLMNDERPVPVIPLPDER